MTEPGGAGHCGERLGNTRQVWSGIARLCKAGLDNASAWQVWLSLSEARRGRAGRGHVTHGKSRQGRYGAARPGKAWLGASWKGQAVQVRTGQARLNVVGKAR